MEELLNEHLDTPEVERGYLKNEIKEKENYLNNQKIKLAEEIKNTLGRDINSNSVIEEPKKSKIKLFFEKLFNTCK